MLEIWVPFEKIMWGVRKHFNQWNVLIVLIVLIVLESPRISSLFIFSTMAAFRIES